MTVGCLDTTTALVKRIRRHVIGKSHDFFVVAAPGLEEICRAELAALGLNGRAVAGGVEFTGRLPDGYLANLHLRTASRVLMRVHSFHAVHFSELEKLIGSFAWELFLEPGAIDRIQVTTHRCRLHHTQAIADRVREGIERRLGTSETDKRTGSSQKVFVRGVQDRFTVSIDSSGANLYLRGLKAHPGRAPLRETIAAAGIMLGGFRGVETLLDPMCGTGSFSLEAALIAKNIPPGWFRDFAFTRWPAFRPQRWEHLRRKSAERFAECESPRILASDIDPAACRALESSLHAHGLADAVAVACRDFFNFDPREVTDRPGLVVINPPYGRRIGNLSESRELKRAIVARLLERYTGWKFVLMTPAGSDLPAITLPIKGVYPFFHGGLQVRIMVGRVPFA
jgi:putative N6-adenine-specific DNA methylase